MHAFRNAFSLDTKRKCLMITKTRHKRTQRDPPPHTNSHSPARLSFSPTCAVRHERGGFYHLVISWIVFVVVMNNSHFARCQSKVLVHEEEKLCLFFYQSTFSLRSMWTWNKDGTHWRSQTHPHTRTWYKYVILSVFKTLLRLPIGCLLGLFWIVS